MDLKSRASVSERIRVAPIYFNLSRWMDGDAIIGKRTGEDQGDIKSSALDMLHFRCL